MDKKLVAAIVLLAFAFVALVFWPESKQPDLVLPAAQKTVKIGAILPLTGEQAYLGQWMKNGIDLAVEELNAKQGSSNKIKVLYEDSQGDQKSAISAFNKLKDIEGAKLFITTQSHVSLALAPLAEKSKTPLFTIAVAPSILDAGDYIFINNFTGKQELGLLADFIDSNFHFKKMAVLAQNIEFGVQYKNVIESKWKEKGRPIVASELFDSKATDYKTQLTKIKDSNPDFVYIVGYSPHLGRILVQAKELGIEKPLFTYWGARDKKVIETAKEAAEGLTFPASPFSSKTAPEFFEKYSSKFGGEPAYQSGLAYDIVGLFATALSTCGWDEENTTCIKDEIYNIENYPGVTGPTTVTKDGGTTKEIIFWKIENSEFVPWQGFD